MVTFSGVGSGLDLSSLVDGIVAAERIPIEKLNARKAVATARISTLGNLVTKMQALATKAKELDSSSELRALKVASSGPGRVTATATNGAVPANYGIKVNSLAAAQSNKSTSFATTESIGTGMLSINVGADDPIDVAFDDSMSLQDIATAINDSDARVKASVINDGSGYRLLVTGEAQGTDNAMSFGGDGASVLGFDAADTLVRAAEDAEIEVDGLVITRSSNRISDLFEGVTLDLHSITPDTEGEATVAVEEDREGTREKMQGFVDAYNEVHKVLAGELTKSGTDVSKAQMLGDSTLRGLQRRLGSIVGGGYAHGADSVALGSVGISLSRDGSLSIDAAKFDKITSEDPTALSDLFTGTPINLTAELGTMVEEYTASSTGILTSKRSGLESRISDFEEQIDRVEVRATKVGDRMRKTFTALDQTVSALQSQQSQLMAALYGTAG